MAIFGPKPCVNPFGKMSIFQLLELLVFIAQKSVFSFQNIVKDIFLGYIAFRKNMSIFRLLKILFLQLKETFFSSRRWSKTFCRPILPKKRKVAKTIIFGPKPWVNPFGKMSIFLLFDLLLFIAQKGVFSIQNIVKDIFLDYIAYKKKVGKMVIFGPKPCVKPVGKMSIFLLFELFVFIDQKNVLSLQNIFKDIFQAYIA